MPDLHTALFVALLVSSLLVYRLDLLLRRNTTEDVGGDTLGSPPGYWSNPRLFTKRGNRIRVGLWIVVAAQCVVALTLLVSTLDSRAPSLLNGLIVFLAAAALAVAFLDQKLRQHLAPGVRLTELQFQLVYWGQPQLFTPRGNRVRLAILAVSATMLAAFVLIAMLVP